MRFFIQIGGQGGTWLKEFAKYYADPKMKRFYDTILETIESEIPNLNGFPDFYAQFQPRKWLEEPESQPDDVYLGRALVSMAMIQATQLAHLEYARVNGAGWERILEHTVGITGHSQGLVTATMLGLGLKGDDYYKGVENYTRYLIHLGFKSQETQPDIYPSEEEIRQSEEAGSKTVEPMVAVLGGGHSNVEKLVEEVNQSLDPKEKIYISLYNTPTNRVLSSTRASLIKFNQVIRSQVEEKKVKYVYLRSSSPFHSLHMEPMLESFDESLKKIDFPYQGSDLKIPVYSFSDGRNMQNDSHLGLILSKELMVWTLYWEKAIQPIIESDDLDAVIDLGPGKVSQRLSEEILKTHDKEITTYMLSNPKGQSDLTERFS